MRTHEPRNFDSVEELQSLVGGDWLRRRAAGLPRRVVLRRGESGRRCNRPTDSAVPLGGQRHTQLESRGKYHLDDGIGNDHGVSYVCGKPQTKALCNHYFQLSCSHFSFVRQRRSHRSPGLRGSASYPGWRTRTTSNSERVVQS